jgi:hypothetical protein
MTDQRREPTREEAVSFLDKMLAENPDADVFDFGVIETGDFVPSEPTHLSSESRPSLRSRIGHKLDLRMTRRGFDGNVVKYGLAGAIGIWLATRSKSASAIYCFWETQYTECRVSSSCGGYSTWAFQKQVCCPNCYYTGYARWTRLYCGC